MGIPLRWRFGHVLIMGRRNAEPDRAERPSAGISAACQCSSSHLLGATLIWEKVLMIVGVPKEIKDHETRVGLVPSGVIALREAGHRVLVETQAGTGSSIPDKEYAD